MLHALRSLLVAPLLILATSALAQGYPSRPIEILVGFAPGGGTDLTIRMLEPVASKHLGQKITVTNRPGAGGSIMFNQFIKAPPDGYTLAIGTTAGLTLQPHILADTVQYQRDDYVPVVQLSFVPNLIIVPPDSPFKTFADLLEHAKKSPPGSIKVGITSPGNTPHLPFVQMEKMYGLKFTYIPHKSSEPVVTAVMGGHVDVGSADLAAVGPKLPAGSVRALGLFSTRRLSAFPDVPTLKELGTDIQAGFYNVLVAPRGTPDSVVAVLGEAFRKTLKDPAIVERAAKTNLPLEYLDRLASRERIDKDFAASGILLTELGLKK